MQGLAHVSLLPPNIQAPSLTVSKTAPSVRLLTAYRNFVPYVSAFPSGPNARGSWDAVLQELGSFVRSKPKQRQSPFPVVPNTVHRRESRSSTSSHTELPSSIKLSPPPEGEIPSLSKTSQKVGQVNRRQVLEEYVS